MALWGTVAFSVESGNIVGYMSKDAQKNVTTAGSMFMNVGSAELDIQSIVPTQKGSNKPSTAGGVYIQTLTSLKATDEVFYWYEDDEEEPPLELMWYNKNKKTPATKKFKPGEGFFFTANKDIYINISGEVLKTNLLCAAQKNVTVFSNPYAVNLPIANLVPTANGGNKPSTAGGVYIQTLTSLKATDEVFYWYEDDEEEPPLELMWYNKNKKTPATKSFAPGEGFFFTANKDIFLQFIAPATLAD